MGDSYVIQTGDFVSVSITASFPCACIEKRFAKGITIADLKGKLELATGASSASMTIKVYSKEDKLVCELDNDNALLGSYHIDDGMRLHVEDNFVLRKQLEDDASQDLKFELSEEDYKKRQDTLHAFLKQNKIGKYNEEEMAKREAEKKKEEEKEEEKAKSIKVGDRCQVTVPGLPVRRATVMFVGKTSFQPGYWIGVKYDEPLGKNDGSCGGTRYFECPPKYGGFVRPTSLEVGDFPEEEINFEEDEL